MKKGFIWLLKYLYWKLIYLKSIFLGSLVRLTAEKIGKNIHVNGFTKVNSKTIICNNTHSGKNLKLIVGNHNFDKGNKVPYDETWINKKIIIKDNVWIGINVICIGNVVIEEGSIIGAGSVVVNDVPKCAIVGGNLAKILKYRDCEHYENLQSNGQFF